MNQTVLHAELSALDALRYTPAGLAALDVVLRHVSEQQQAGLARQLDFELEAVAFGDLAHWLAQQPIGSILQCEGFFAPTRKASRRLKLHLCACHTLKAPSP